MQRAGQRTSQVGPPSMPSFHRRLEEMMRLLEAGIHLTEDLGFGLDVHVEELFMLQMCLATLAGHVDDNCYLSGTPGCTRASVTALALPSLVRPYLDATLVVNGHPKMSSSNGSCTIDWKVCIPSPADHARLYCTRAAAAADCMEEAPPTPMKEVPRQSPTPR